MDAIKSLMLPERRIPAPASLSPEARAALAKGVPWALSPAPSIEDVEAWRQSVSDMSAGIAPFADMIFNAPNLDVRVERIGCVDVYSAARKGEDQGGSAKVNLILHGGGWVYGGGRAAVLPAGQSAFHHGGLVFSPDYRLAPDHPYPAALDDCLQTYEALIRRFDPGRILLSGESAGGNLAAALLLKARDLGLPPPAALYLNTPALDLTFASDSIETNRGLDTVLPRGIEAEAQLYRAGASARDPYVSPLYGELSSGFPPTYLRTGTRDLLLSDSVRMHAALRKAGVEADLYVGEAMPHGGFLMFGQETPEDIDARADLGRWLARHWPAQAVR